VTWDLLLPWIFGDEFEKLDIEKTYPNYFAWNAKLMARPAVQKVAKLRQEAMSAPGH